jgi:FtsP/CotA-like multicopper oxidase with cupredoxin domain
MNNRESSLVQRLVGRRTFLGAGLTALALGAVGRAGAAFSSASIAASGPASARAQAKMPRRRLTGGAASVRDIRLDATVGDVEVGPGVPYRTWLYNGQFPGPALRVVEGDRLQVTLANGLPEETTIHWHGVPVPNVMDGVPDITQEAVRPGAQFIYDFVAQPAGTYMYHSHFGLQLDRALVGGLVIEERSAQAAYDRDYVVVLDDFLPIPPAVPSTGGGMMGGMALPPYAGLLINGKLPAAAPAFDIRSGERARFRFVNPSGSTTFRVAIAGHRMTVTHTDGRPVESATVDSLVISMGERYDVIVAAHNPGAWAIVAAPVEGALAPARAVLRYLDSAQTAPASGQVPEGLTGGEHLLLSSLHALEPLLPYAPQPDRQFDLVLSGGMMSSAWTINGQTYPNASPLEIYAGERIRFRMTNRSMAIHPMHLHGHFFQVGSVWKDTVMVPPMGSASFDFVADNPGNWFFHCHNAYHMEMGMARVVRYL